MAPLVFGTLFATIRLNLLVQRTQKGITQRTERIADLTRAVEELRGELADLGDFSRVEPRAEQIGLRPIVSGQVLALLPEDVPLVAWNVGEPPTRSERLLAGLADALTPASAQAGEPATLPAAHGEHRP